MAISLVNEPPGCALCASDLRLLSAIAYTLCLINTRSSEGCDPATLLEDAKCYKCDSDKELLALALGFLVDYAKDLTDLSSLTVASVLQDAKCLECAGPKQVKGIIVKELGDAISYLDSLIVT